AVHQDGAFVRNHGAREHLDEGAFARAVLAAERVHLADSQVQAHAVKRTHAAVRLADALHADQRRAVGRGVHADWRWMLLAGADLVFARSSDLDDDRSVALDAGDGSLIDLHGGPPLLGQVHFGSAARGQVEGELETLVGATPIDCEGTPDG